MRWALISNEDQYQIMAENRNQLHYRIETLMKYYGIRDEEKLLMYLKDQEAKVQPSVNKWQNTFSKILKVELVTQSE